jgi:hypothetical protein
VGTPAVSRKAVIGLPRQLHRPAFYARTGTPRRDLLALLHTPYTVWHLSYVVFGAALAPEVDLVRLAGTLAAFFFGTGIAAHALDEWHSRPLRTALSDGALVALATLGLGAALFVAILGALVVSPWTLVWAAAGVVLVLAYALEWDRRVHSDLGFALAWGAFPVLVGYWAQTEDLSIAALLVANAATLLSLAQRALSTPARHTRRRALGAEVRLARYEGDEVWSREQLLATWEGPLKLLAATTVVLALGLLLARL